MTKFNIKKLVKPTINKIAKYIPGEAKDNEGEKYIKLSSNESPFKIPERIFSMTVFCKPEQKRLETPIQRTGCTGQTAEFP